MNIVKLLGCLPVAVKKDPVHSQRFNSKLSGSISIKPRCACASEELVYMCRVM